MAVVVKPAVFTDVSPCVVVPPNAPSFRTTAEIVPIEEAEPFCWNFAM